MQTEPEGGEALGACPYVHAAMELVGRRWSGLVVQVLSPGPRHFQELRQLIPDVSPTMLSQRLRELEAAGLLTREIEAGPPVHVGYRLTASGRALGPVLDSLTDWARRWLDAPSGPSSKEKTSHP